MRSREVAVRLLDLGFDALYARAMIDEQIYRTPAEIKKRLEFTVSRRPTS